MSKELLHDDLTKAEVDEVYADFLAKAKAHLAEAERERSYLEEYGVEDPESAGTALVKLGDEARVAQELVRELREYWASKHPEQTL
jgi:hypothetical protein